MISQRQKEILKSLIEEYINSAQPISSQLLEKKHRFGICPATIRMEMQKLTSRGFLSQPYPSAGRVPTDKGYRFFVDELLKKGLQTPKEELEINWQKEIEDSLKLIQKMTKFLASRSSNLALGYLFSKRAIWKEGWEEVFQEPEFKERKFIFDFTKLLKSFEEKIEKMKFNHGIRIYIGKENPFPRSRDFSTIISKCHLPTEEEGILAILGPKRMNYQRNIGWLNYLIKFLEEI